MHLKFHVYEVHFLHCMCQLSLLVILCCMIIKTFWGVSVWIIIVISGKDFFFSRKTHLESVRECQEKMAVTQGSTKKKQFKKREQLFAGKVWVSIFSLITLWDDTVHYPRSGVYIRVLDRCRQWHDQNIQAEIPNGNSSIGNWN